MGDLAAANVNRSYQLTATSVAIFTFSMAFLYPRYASGEANPTLFQVTVVVMGFATFSFVFAAINYYGSSLVERFSENARVRYAAQGDGAWLLGLSLLLLVPTLILFTVGLTIVGVVWLVMWLAYLVVIVRYFPHIRTTPRP